MQVIRMAIPVVVLLLLTGCSTTKKISSWSAGNEISKPHTKMLILGFVPYAETDVRENIEIKFEEAFQKNGVNAVSSLKLLGTTVFDRMDEEDALYQLNNNCVDAVLTVTLLKRSRENKYTAGLIHDTPYSYYYDRFWRYRTTMQYRAGEPGYFNDMGDVFLECNLYDMVTQKLVYSAQSGSFTISNYSNETDRVLRRIIRDLAKRHNKADIRITGTIANER